MLSSYIKLEILERELFLARSRAHAAFLECQHVKGDHFTNELRDKHGITHGDKIKVRFTSGDLFFEFDRVVIDFDLGVIIYGKRLYKNGGKAKYNVRICEYDYLRFISKVDKS